MRIKHARNFRFVWLLYVYNYWGAEQILAFARRYD